MQYLLSIIIPTKNRQFYCAKAVEQILSIGGSVQVVVQDNSDDDSLKNQLPKNERVKYNYHEGVVSFVDNFSEALSLADGEYLCMIGDDDGVLPNILTVVEFAKTNGYEGVTPGLNSVYYWPTESSFVKNGEKGYLCLSFIKNGYSDFEPINGVYQLMKTAGQGYQTLDLPRIYHGLIHRNILEKIRQKTGKYFDGLTPDIYMSVSLGLTVEKACRLNYPITVSGICPRSGSSDSATGKHTGELKDAPHFKGHNSYEWNKKAPAIYSVESIWAETCLHALENFGREDLFDKFRVDVLDAICLWKYPQFKEIILEHAKNHGVRKFRLIFLKNWQRIKAYIRRVCIRVFRTPKSVKKLYGVSNIGEAVEFTRKMLK